MAFNMQTLLPQGQAEHNKDMVYNTKAPSLNIPVPLFINLITVKLKFKIC